MSNGCDSSTGKWGFAIHLRERFAVHLREVASILGICIVALLGRPLAGLSERGG